MKVSNNFFEKIKPIVKSWKTNKTKPEMKDSGTSMDCNMTILTDFEKSQSISPNTVEESKTASTQTDIMVSPSPPNSIENNASN